MKRALRLCLPAALLLLAGLLAGPVGAQSSYSESTDVVVVEVPIQVIRDGVPVRGLTADDFEVYERGRKQKIVGFEVLDLALQVPEGLGGAKRQAPAPVAARRHFLLLFDLSFSSPKAVTVARQAAREVIGKLHPSDLVAVGSYISTTGAKLLLAFSGDRDQALAAIEEIGMPTALDRVPDPLRLVFGQSMAGGGGGGGGGGGARGGGGGGGSGGADKREAIVEALGDAAADFDSGTQRNMARAQRGQQERSVSDMTRSLAEFARMMQGVRGRKHVVLFSEGFDSALVHGSANIDEQNDMATASMAGEIWNIDSETRFGSTKTANDLEVMLEEFRRADCVVQAIDIGGLREGARPEDQWAGGRDSLFRIAEETGGELFENYNDLDIALEQMLERTSVTYVLAFQPEEVKRDGAYHRLRVELKDAPRGTRLVHRPGYYTPRPHQQQSPLEQALTAGERILSGFDGGTIRTSVLAAPFPAGPGEAYVPVLIEIDGDGLLAGSGGTGDKGDKGNKGALPADVFAYAFDSQGKVVDFFSQTLALDLAKVGPALRQTGVKFFGHLDLVPGEYSVRVLVRNTATGNWGLKATTLSVPEFAASSPVLLPPFFPETPGEWLVVREAPREGDRSVAYPFMAGEEPYIPASLPALQPGREAKLSLVAYHLRPGDLSAEALILTADGREAGTGRVRIVERHGSSGKAGAGESLTAAFEPPAGLQPGEYMLLLKLTGPGGAAQSSVAAFTVAKN